MRITLYGALVLAGFGLNYTAWAILLTGACAVGLAILDWDAENPTEDKP